MLIFSNVVIQADWHVSDPQAAKAEEFHLAVYGLRALVDDRLQLDVKGSVYLHRLDFLLLGPEDLKDVKLLQS